ncbi:MAG: hypothetical protein KDD28_32815, partial [Phaeodactylibacter sp.]|nr:hypothetical protein [Phaeodactylibacter sp.]
GINTTNPAGQIYFILYCSQRVYAGQAFPPSDPGIAAAVSADIPYQDAFPLKYLFECAVIQIDLALIGTDAWKRSRDNGFRQNYLGGFDWSFAFKVRIEGRRPPGTGVKNIQIFNYLAVRNIAIGSRRVLILVKEP